MTLEDWQWAWLAGLFEGEGCISFTNTTGKYTGTSVQVKILMTDRDVIETLDRLIPTPRGVRVTRYAHKKDQWTWKLSSKAVIEEFLRGVLPYLHSRRRERAEAALERLSHCLGAHALRTHCKRGHPLSGDNVRITAANGSRHCKTCARAQERTRKRT